MSNRSESPDDDNQSRKRHLLSTNNEALTPSKRSKRSTPFGAFLAPLTSLFGMFRNEKHSKEPTEKVFEVSDDEDDSSDSEIAVVSTSPKKVESSQAIIFLNADAERLEAGVDPSQNGHDEKKKEEEEDANDIVVEKHIQKNVEVSDDSDENEVEEVQIVQPLASTSTHTEPVIKTSEVQQDDDVTVQFVKLVKTPNKNLQNARLYQNEIIFLNENQDEDGSSVQFDTSETAVFASPTPDESASRPRTPNDWNRSSPYSVLGSRNVRDYWRRSTAKKPMTKRSLVRQQFPDSTVIKKFASSQIQKSSKNSGVREMQLAKYLQGLVDCGYYPAETKFSFGREKKITANKPKQSTSDLIFKAKMLINASRGNTPTVLSRESSIIAERTPVQTPSSSSETPSSTKLSNMLQKIEDMHLSSVSKDRYVSVYEQSKRKVEDLGEVLRIRGGHRIQSREDRFESLRKDLQIQGIVLRPKKPVVAKDEFMQLPDSADLLIEKAWTKALRQDEQFVDAFSIQICRKDLVTLSGLNWLNDNIINFYLQLICQRSAEDSKYPKVYAFNTFFYTNVVEKGYASVKRWTRKVDIFSYDILLVPVHLGMHWCMSVIDVTEKRVEFYDSLYNGNEVVLPALKGYLASESMDKKKVPFDFSGWSMQQMEDIPRQKNGSDCGVFSCQFGEWASRRKVPEFSQKHMPYYRKRMVHEIVTKKLLATL